ncbi:hypothetical protein VTI28DRAFT_10487 [Corynascus sepedonium]
MSLNALHGHGVRLYFPFLARIWAIQPIQNPLRCGPMAKRKISGGPNHGEHWLGVQLSHPALVPLHVHGRENKHIAVLGHQWFPLLQFR